MITFEQLLLEVSLDQLKRDWVDSGKLDAELFQIVCELANNQSAYVTWLVKRISEDPEWQETIKTVHQGAGHNWGDVVTEWNNWFEIFTKNKQYFEKKDINQYKKVTEWVEAVVRAEQAIKDKKESKDIDNFKIGSVVADNGVGYLVYKLPKGHAENRQVSIALGRHAPEDRGWCTAYDSADVHYWDDHIAKEDLYIFVNPKDRLRDKFQIQPGYYDSRPFPIKTDVRMDDDEVGPYLPFYDFLHEKEGRKYPKFYEKVKQLEEAVNNFFATEQSTSLEPYKFTDDSYKIELSGDLKWLVPVASLYGKAQTDIPRGLVSKLLETLKNGDHRRYYFVKDGDDHFRIFYTTFEVFFSARLFFDLLPSIGVDVKDFSISCRDDDRVLYERVKEVIAKDNLRADLRRSIFKNLAREDASRARAEEIARRRSEKTAQQARRAGTTPEVLTGLARWKVATLGSTSYYLVDAITARDGIRQLCGDAEDLASHLVDIMEGTVGLVLQGGILVILNDITDPRGDGSVYNYSTVTRVDLDTKSITNNHMNPDTIYSLYKAFKAVDDNVKYPGEIKVVNDIKEGSLDRYSIPNVGQAKKLYKIPTTLMVGMLRDFPYSLPQGYRESQFIILGFISKWQFTLDSRGGFILTGRWGSGGSRSWIQSVPGLAETLTQLCDRYHIPAVRALAALQELCTNNGFKCPKIIQEALIKRISKWL